MAYLLVMLGGAVGSAARYGVGRITLSAFGPNYPWGTLAVNLIGGLAMGLCVGHLARLGQGVENWRLFIAVGVLGGFTTFSAFTLDMVNMIQRGDWTTAMGYVTASVIGAAVALTAGLMMTRTA